jgi:hypothetical protein
VRQGHRSLKCQSCLHPLSVLCRPLINRKIYKHHVHLINYLLSHTTPLYRRISQFRPLAPFIFIRRCQIHFSHLQQRRRYRHRCVIHHRRPSLRTVWRPPKMENLMLRPSHPQSRKRRVVSFAKKPSWRGLSPFQMTMTSTSFTVLRTLLFLPRTLIPQRMVVRQPHGALPFLADLRPGD